MASPLRDRLGDSAHTLYLLDISSFIFRAFFAIRSLSNRSGEPTNAVYGVATMLARLIEEAQPQFLSVVYDSKEPTFRKELYPEYKANRSAPPEDLIPQFGRIEQLVSLMKLPSSRLPGCEADDLIATLAREWREADPKNRVVVVTGDKDLMQLVDDRLQVWDTMAQKIYSETEVIEKFGVKPGQIRDYLAMVGDSSDNIPGVPSIGPKTAADLLRDFGDLDSILAGAKDGKIAGKKGETLKNNEKDARLSAELASLMFNCDIPVVREKLQFRFEIEQDCLDFLREMDFNTLCEKWKIYLKGGDGSLGLGGVTSTPVERSAPAESGESGGTQARAGGAYAAPEVSKSTALIPFAAGEFEMINTESGLKAVIAEIEKRGEFGFDLETTSLNPREAELCGVSLSMNETGGVYIPVGHRGTNIDQLPEKLVLDSLRPYLENPKYKKIGQNLKYDFSVMQAMGFKPDGIGADTMIAAYVLEPEGRHNLSALALEHLGYVMLEYEQVCGKGKDQIGFDQVPLDQATRYSAEDSWIALKLWHTIKPKIEAAHLMEIFARVDLPLIGVLSRMESEGFCIDEKWLAQLSREFSAELKTIETKIAEFTSGPVNLNSPKQLAVLLFEHLKLPPQGKTKTGYSTDASVLEVLAPMHEVPRLLLEYREISKLKGTYVAPLPAMRDKKTGKIHAGFHQAVAATGRLSSSDPNLQNIPIRSERGRKIRRAFIASPGNVLIGADYSQIELRILAHMSDDKELVASFLKDEDVHRRTASEIFSVAPEAIDDRQRSIAKAINFGLMYGKTAFGLAQELKIPRKEAQETIDRYFQRYSGVKRFLDGLVLEAREKGYAITILGRKRNLRDISSRNQALRNNAERMAMNSPIQGTAADLMKLAMIELDHELVARGFKARLICQVHDEVLIDCPKAEADAVQKLVVDVMEGAMKLSVPLRVNAAQADNWMDL